MNKEPEKTLLGYRTTEKGYFGHCEVSVVDGKKFGREVILCQGTDTIILLGDQGEEVVEAIRRLALGEGPEDEDRIVRLGLRKVVR